MTKKNTNLGQEAYDRFKELLFAKVWKPGDFVSQGELVEKTGVQISPMRDALHKLSAEGLVIITPRKGIQVTPASIKIIREVFHLRKVLEREAVEFFVNNAHDNLIKELKENHQGYIVISKKAKTPQEMREIIQQEEYDIHEKIINFLGNDLIARIYRLNADRIRLFRLDYDFSYTTEHVVDALNEHGKIIDSMASRNLNKTLEKMDHHLSMALQRALGPPYL